MYKDCDHLIDNNYIYTIRGNWNIHSELLLAKPVYYRESRQTEYVKIVDKKGDIGENMVWINPQSMKHINCKGINVKEFSDDSIWSKIVQQLIKLGISPNDIGVFGSKRLGFKQCKDVDFIIYGKDKMQLLKENIETFKSKVGLYNHTILHASYQALVHGEYLDKKKNDLLLCLLNKWSTCAFSERLTTTIRFVNEKDKSGDLLKSLLYKTDLSNNFEFSGVVSNAENTSFIPRIFSIANKQEKYDVVTPLWIFHQCVKNNDLVRVTGSLVNNKIVIRRYDHGIKFV